MLTPTVGLTENCDVVLFQRGWFMILMFGVTYVYPVVRKSRTNQFLATMNSYSHPSTSRRATRLTVGIEVFLRICFCAVLATQANREGVQCRNGTPFGAR